MGNEIELSEPALAAQSSELKEEEEFGKRIQLVESPDPLKREEISKKKKSASKKEGPGEVDKF